MLSACAQPTGFRDKDTRISATTRFDATEMSGRWIVRERFADDGDEAGRLPENFVFGAVEGARVKVSREHLTCNSWECVGLTDELNATLSGPGRFTMPRDDIGQVEHWVLWADADYRVVAIGTPSGAFGWIMTKGKPRSDLMLAARGIFEWNGYDMTRLQGVDE